MAKLLQRRRAALSNPMDASASLHHEQQFCINNEFEISNSTTEGVACYMNNTDEDLMRLQDPGFVK